MAIATVMVMAASVDCVELMVIDSVSEMDPEETKYLQKKYYNYCEIWYKFRQIIFICYQTPHILINKKPNFIPYLFNCIMWTPHRQLFSIALKN